MINLIEPSRFLNVERFEQARVGTAICGTVGYTGKSVNFGLLIHLIRETGDGCEMRSRFWLGDIEITWFPKKGVVNRMAGSKVIAKRAVPTESPPR